MTSSSPSRAESAGAKLALAAALAVAFVLPSVLTWLYFVRLADATAELQQAVYAVGKTFQFALPALVYWLVLSSPGRSRRPSRAGVAEGFGSGLFVCLSAAALYRVLAELEPAFLAALARQVEAKIAGLGLDGGGRYLAVAVFYSLVHAALEEYYWRWFVYGQLRRLLPSRLALVVAALGFMAHHVILVGFYTGWNWPASLALALAVGLGGAYWAWLYERSGSLTGPWISHLFADAAIFALGWALIN